MDDCNPNCADREGCTQNGRPTETSLPKQEGESQGAGHRPQRMAARERIVRRRTFNGRSLEHLLHDRFEHEGAGDRQHNEQGHAATRPERHNSSREHSESEQLNGGMQCYAE